MSRFLFLDLANFFSKLDNINLVVFIILNWVTSISLPDHLSNDFSIFFLVSSVIAVLIALITHFVIPVQAAWISNNLNLLF